MRIHSNGDVGIGTKKPDVRLDVAQDIGTSEVTQLRILNTSPSAANNTAYIGFNSYNGGGANWGIGSKQLGADQHDNVFHIMYSGGGGTYNKFVTLKPSNLNATATPLFGIGVTLPTNALHVYASADPLKLEGVQNGTGENLVIDANGVVKKGPASSSYEVLFDLSTLPAATMSDGNPNGDDTRAAVEIQSQTITLTKDALVQINYSVPIWNVVKYGTTVAPTDGGSKMLRTQLVVDNGIATRSTNVYSNSSTGTGTGTSPEALRYFL